MPNATDAFILRACRTGIDAFQRRKLSTTVQHGGFAIEFAYVSRAGARVLKMTVTRSGRRGEVLYRAAIGLSPTAQARNRTSLGTAPAWASRLESCLTRGILGGGTGQVNNAHGALRRTLSRQPSFDTIDAINDSVLRTGFPLPPHRIVPYEERWLTGNLPMVIGRTPEIDWRAHDRRQLSSNIERNIQRMRANRLRAPRVTRHPALPPNTRPTIVRYRPHPEDRL